MSDYGIEQEIGQAIVKVVCVQELFPMSAREHCGQTHDECRACWHEWARGVLKGEGDG